MGPPAVLVLLLNVLAYEHPFRSTGQLADRSARVAVEITVSGGGGDEGEEGEDRGELHGCGGVGS